MKGETKFESGIEDTKSDGRHKLVARLGRFNKSLLYVCGLGASDGLSFECLT